MSNHTGRGGSYRKNGCHFQKFGSYLSDISCASSTDIYAHVNDSIYGQSCGQEGYPQTTTPDDNTRRTTDGYTGSLALMPNKSKPANANCFSQNCVS